MHTGTPLFLALTSVSPCHLLSRMESLGRAALGQHAEVGRVQGGGLPYDVRWYVRMGLSGPLTPCGPTSPHVLTPSAPSPRLLETLAAQQAPAGLFDAIFVDEAQDCTPGDKAFGTSVVSNT